MFRKVCRRLNMNSKNNKITIFCTLIMFVIFFISVGYAAFETRLFVTDMSALVKVAADIRVTGVGVDSSTNGGISNYEEYNVHNISSSIKLPNYNSTVTYRVEVTNFESAEMGLYALSGLPDNLTYDIAPSNYVLKDKICDSDGKCNLGITKELLITIKYKSISVYNRNNVLFDFVLDFDFRPFYDITYDNVDSSGYPTEIIKGDTLSITIDDDALDSVDVKVNNIVYDNYTLSGTNLSVSNVTGDLNIDVKYFEKPMLVNKLVPVKYNGSNWIVTTYDDPEWYDYENQKWANAVILNDGVSSSKGTVIYLTENNTNIKGLFVWIPRYSYTIGNKYGVQLEGGSAPTVDTPGAIDIKFYTNKLTESGTASYTGNTPSGWRTHPAFTFGNDEIGGIWVGKFETTGSATVPTIVPNAVSLKNQVVSVQFATAQIFNNYLNNSKIDAHMAKNSEWGAAAYLSQSKYGKYGNSSYTGVNKEIMYNNCTNYITGIAANSYDEANNTDVCTSNTYETVKGQAASTTGNIYGIYDMSGGSWEYAMGYLEGSSDTWGATSSGDYALFSEKIDTKYYDSYTSADSLTACNGGPCYGQGLFENANWYGAISHFVRVDVPYLTRGGNIAQPDNASVFFAARNLGNASKRTSFRVILSTLD